MEKNVLWLSLDLATKSTGLFAWFPEVKLNYKGLIKSENYHSQLDAEDLITAINAADSRIQDDDKLPDLFKIRILCETSPYGQNAWKFGIVLGKILQTIEHEIYYNGGIELITIAPNSWQNYFWPKHERPKDNDNRKWLKKMSKERASNRLDTKITNDDVADAFNMFDYYMIKSKGKTIIYD